MKNIGNKKLHLKKISVAKLNVNDMSLINGGRKSGRPACYDDSIVAYSNDRLCPTRQINCTSPTVIVL